MRSSPGLTALAALVTSACLGAAGTVTAHAAPGDPVPQAGPTVDRVWGPSRIETAVSASVLAYGQKGAANVVLARSDAFADSLAAGPLASDRGGPLLLTPPGSLAPEVAAEIRRVLADGGTVYLLGGTSALSAGVETAVRNLGVRVQRVQGADRYATAVEVAKLMPAARHAALVTGRNFPDGLAAGALMGVQEEGTDHTTGVVLLTDGEALPPVTRDYIDQRGFGRQDSYVVPIGGEAVRASRPLPVEVERVAIAGNDRYDTAARVARHFVSTGPFFRTPGNSVGVATGEDWPDALAGSAVMGYTAGPLLLTRPNSLPAETAGALNALRDDARNAGGVTIALVFGGPRAVADSQLGQISAALG
ncbi:putative cell wall binding repeat protein [Kineococcus xinjiangensis]|uniref:Putative cell wall binding repeat protein n=1 Tax=Kineococcus xinjiangensis TaxID=512762 RepID=A0A2S6ITZ4_9ACTN|nr:cell wall-binding repeat-containing protein [Kineococcus xinjiangensis]PPK97719.1 putative cell wall binding repeat protein [Kineococcus xinjiangensis]